MQLSFRSGKSKNNKVNNKCLISNWSVDLDESCDADEIKAEAIL